MVGDINDMSHFNLERHETIKNMIGANTIELYPDHSELNIHFKYRDIEVSSILNQNPLRRIDQIVNDNEIEKIPEDFFRSIVIHLKLDSYIALEDDEDLYDEDEYDDPEDGDEEDDSLESYNTRLEKDFPGLYLTSKQKDGYARARSRVYTLIRLMDIEEKDIYTFVSKNGLVINDDNITFYAPMLSQNSYEYIFWCVTIIDKIIQYFSDDEEEDDTEGLLDE